MLVSSLLVTATSMSASSAPAWRSTVGKEPRPWMVRMSSRSLSSRRRSPSVSTTVMSLASLARCSARVPPTWPAPRMMIFTAVLPCPCAAGESAPRAGGDLHQPGVVEAVMPLGLRQQLAAVGLLQAEAAGDVQLARTRGAGQEGADVSAVFFRQHRAGGVDQDAADLQGRPQGIQQFSLQPGQGADVLGLAGQLDVRVTTDHAGGRTGRIQQDALERLAVP